VLGSFTVGAPELLRGLQERTARALPAELIVDVDGWWLRHDLGSAWWAATVLPHRDVASADLVDLVARVAAAEKFYASHGAPARFQVSPGVCPVGLDAVLAERGYQRHSVMSVQVAPTAHVQRQPPTEQLLPTKHLLPTGHLLPIEHLPPTGPLRVWLEEQPTRAWFDTWYAVHGHGGDAGTEWAMLERVDQPCAYAAAVMGDQVVAVGRAVADTGWAGVFGMATLPEARGKGAAGKVLAALAEWAGAQAADHMYLQVEYDNSAALRLYERIGFVELCGYHYRIAT
jgi:GNAT superfamily N-acetyltransferase